MNNNKINIKSKKNSKAKTNKNSANSKTKTTKSAQVKTNKFVENSSKQESKSKNIEVKVSSKQKDVKNVTIKEETNKKNTKTNSIKNKEEYKTKKANIKIEIESKELKEKAIDEEKKKATISKPVSNSKNSVLKKVLTITSLAIKTLFIIFFIINLAFLLKIDILPTKYLSIFILISSLILIFNILTEFILKNKVMKIVSTILSILSIILYIFVYIYVSKTDKFINGLFTDEQIETYYIAVLNDSTYDNITDLENLKIGTYYHNLESYNNVINNINKLINFEEVKYNSLFEICEDLNNRKIDAILINDENKNIIEEINELDHIELKYICDVSIKSKLNMGVSNINVVEDPFILYITGIDTYGPISNVARSDVNIIVTVNPKTKQILLVTIPRDYYVYLHGTTAMKDKLTHAGMYGVDMSISTIEDILDIDINYYIRLNFSTLINAIDTIGGIEVYSEYDFNTYGYQFYKGYNYLNGEYALAFSRARKNFYYGDRTRGENQMRVIEAIIAKISSSTVLINDYLNILKSLDGTFQTNLDSGSIYDLIKMQLSSMPKWQIEKYSLNGLGAENYTYSIPDVYTYVMEPDYNTVNEAKTKIKELLEKS